jgi:hypothetical protein
MSSMDYKRLQLESSVRPMIEWNLPLEIPCHHFHRTFYDIPDLTFRKIFVLHVFGLFQGYAELYDFFVLPISPN